ncbi:hypothetical protein [Puerhibacterium puerhi]|uniref:hypothetical protein n=1 Tax=Puerhibacterium puerhi TaxID=2692623 RepID=UPI00135ACFAC|nr:hypothetical protein [Puerhibacterium puerhi]
MAEQCGLFDATCHLGNVAGSVVGNAVESFVRSVGDGTVSVLGWLNTFWMGLPSPDVQSTGVTAIRENLSLYTAVFAIAGFLIAAARVGMTHRLSSGAGAVKMLVNLMAVSAAVTVGFTALMRAGDAFAPWIVEKATGSAMDLDGFLTTDMLLAGGTGPGLFLGIFAFLGSLANVAFMILRDALVLVLFAFLPTLAASSASEAGEQAFKKAMAWLLSFVLFKPVAGAIYALGILTLSSPVEIEGMDDVAQAIYQTCVAVVILAAAALALPALIKFIAPVASNGTSGLFSGGGLAGAAVAGGAAVVALGATGGAAAPAVAGGGAGAASGVASTSAAASGGGGASAAAGSGSTAIGGAAGTGGASSGGGGSTPPASGGSPSGGSPSGGSPSSGSPGSGADGAGRGAGGAGAASSSDAGSGAASSGGDAGTDAGAAAVPAGAAGAASSVPASSGASTDAGPGSRAGGRARAVGDLAQASMTANGAMDDVSEEKR